MPSSHQFCRISATFTRIRFFTVNYTYALKPHRRAIVPALGPARGALADVSLGYAPSLHLLRRVIPLVRRLLRYYGRIRLLTCVNDRVMALGLACPARRLALGHR